MKVIANPLSEEGLQFINEDGAPGAGINPLGEYNNSTDYTVGDSVSYNGSSYVMYVDAPAGTLPTNTTYWQVLAEGGSGDVAGPASSTDNAITRFDGTTGKIIQNSGVIISDTNGVTGVDTLGLDTTYTPTGSEPTGTLYWDSNDDTATLVTQYNNYQIGQELSDLCKNVSGGTIYNGMVCYYAGSVGMSGKPEVTILALDGTFEPSRIIGLATGDIANNDFGKVTTYGEIRNFTTANVKQSTDGAWSVGNILYASNTEAGKLTNVLPEAPYYTAAMCIVTAISGANTTVKTRPSWNCKVTDLADVDGTPLEENGQIMVWDNDNQYFDFTSNIDDFKTYAGFENRTDSTILIDGSGVFSLSATSSSYNVWTNGTGKHNISATQTIEVTDDQTITYIYLDDTGTLQKSTTIWELASGSNAPVSIVFKDGTTYSITDERHGYERNRAWHRWAHNNIGAMYNSGLSGTFTNTTLSVTQGVIYDEDINFDTGGTKTTASLWYRNATSGMRLIRNSTTPYRASAGVLQYDNGSGTLQNVDNAKYVNSWVYCSNDSTEPIYIVIGQNQYNTLNDARNASRPTINLSTAEWKLIYKVTFHNANGTATYDEAIDYRAVQTGVPVTSPSASSHTTLTDRDAASSHPATAISYTPTGNIAATNVQAAINELDSEKAAVSHSHAISDVTGLQTALDGKVDENVAITGATKTKITYDAKGLVTAGADATTADITDSSNKRYVTDSQLVVIGNTSGTNTGDETQSTIKTKLGAATSLVDGYATSTQISKLDGIEAGAEVNNISDVNATDLTDGGATTLHKHSYNNLDDKPTIPTQYTDEMAQDAVGNAVGNGLDYDDASGAISVDPSEFKLDDLGTPDDNTDLNANTTNHGLLLKATAPAAGLYNYIGITNGETAYTNKALFDATAPSTQAFGDAADTGSAAVAARRDHKHAMMAAPTTVTGSAGSLKSPSTTGVGQLSGMGTGTTRVYTVPDADATLLYSGGALGTPTSGTLINCTGLPINGMLNPYKARAYRNGNVTGIADATYTKVQLNAETYDTNNNFDSTTNYRYNVPVTGYYFISAGADLYGTNCSNAQAAVYVDGTKRMQGSYSAAAGEVQSTVSDILYLTAGSYVELYVYADVGSGTVGLAGYTSTTFLSIALFSV